MAQTLVLIDGNSLLYRAFFALPLLTTPQGVPSHAVHGFLLMLTKLYTELKPDRIAVAFDRGRVTFRNQKYADYKGHRPDAPDDLVPQFAMIREVLTTLGIACYEQEGYEGDDLIGTLAQAAAGRYRVAIVTGDRDTLQLVDDNTTVYLTKKGITQMDTMTADRVEEVYHITPAQVVDLKALMGDASDNIPGVPGVGEKTAQKLLGQYGDLDRVYEHLDEIRGPKLQERLRDNREMAYLSQELATIERDVPMTFAWDEMIPQARPTEVEELFRRLGFQQVLPKLEQAGLVAAAGDLFADPAPAPAADIDCIENAPLSVMADWDRIALAMRAQGHVPHVVCQGLAVMAGETAYYWDDAHAPAVLEAVLASELHVVTIDAKACYAVGQVVPSVTDVSDVTIAAYLLDPVRTSYPLSYIAEKFSVALPASDDDKQSLLQEARALAQLDAPVAAALEESGLAALYRDIEMPLVQVLAALERSGIKVDHARLCEIRDELRARIDCLAQEIYESAGETFNILSPKQLGVILFEKLGLPPAKKTKTGYSTSAEVLEGLREAHPVAGQVLEYRTLTKLVSTYLDAMEELTDAETQRIHTSFNQTVTATGRLSSSDPNLQNIPIRTEEGRRIRSMFVPGEGYDGFLSADYSQIELRILSHVSGDKGLQEAFLHGEDIHRRTAAEVLHIAPEEVTDAQRSHAKAVNFGIIYGISDYGLSQDLGISRADAAAYIERYLARYPKVREFMETIVATARETGQVETLFGRVRRLPDIASRNFNRRSFAERTALNTPIQGTAADIIKIAMNRVYWALTAGGYKSRMVVQVHDELVLEVCESEREEVAALVTRCMENAATLVVPLAVDVHYGHNWEDAK